MVPTGYGKGYLEGKSEYAHRLTFKLFFGRFPTRFACHHCDHKWCANPLHLFEGGHAENAADLVAKGLTLRGTESPGHLHRKIDPNRVRDLLIYDFTHREIASWLGISQAHVSLIKTGKFRGVNAAA